MPLTARDPAGLGARFARGVTRMLIAMPVTARARRMRRSARFRQRLAPLPVAPAPERADPVAPNPVAVVVMALDRLGPASIRASLSGTASRVAVPDEATATIFRAALAETQRRRVTDRLIEIVVAER